MKKVTVVVLFLMAAMAIAQDTPPQSQAQAPRFQTNLTERAQAPTYSDLYCSGFITKDNINAANIVSGGQNSPNETLYATGNLIFLEGSGYQEGQRYSVVRQLHDPNRYEPFVGQKAAILSLGQPYADIGRVRVVALRGATAVAEVEFTCQNITIGDVVMAFQEHPPVAYRKNSSLERFHSGKGRVTARIVMAREFDTVVGTGQKVYIDAGTNKGIKVGDYFRAVRGYDPNKIDPVDATAYNAPVGDDTQKVPGKVDRKKSAELPVRNLGQMIVINATSTTATAMITNAFEGIEVGDEVELEEDQQ